MDIRPCPCSRTPRVERYALYPEHGYLSCDCGISFNGHHGDRVERVIERWNKIVHKK